MKYKIGDFVQTKILPIRKGLIVDEFIDDEKNYYDVYLPDIKAIQTYSEDTVVPIKVYKKMKKIISEEYLDDIIEKQIIQYKKDHNINDSKYSILLKDTNLGANLRAYNPLYRAGIESILDLLCLQPKKLYRIRNIGTSIGKEIADFLIDYCLENNIDLIYNKESYYKTSEEIYSTCM